MANFGIKALVTDKSRTEIHAGKIVLDAPAGRHGFLKSKGDNFVFEDGTPFRMWGTNLVFNGNLQSHAGSEQMADNFAKIGYNCIRLHGLDAAAASSFGGVLANTSSMMLFDTAAMDKLDYLIYQLKIRGIYTKLCTHNFNAFKMSDVTDQANMIKNGKVLPYFDPLLENHYRELVQALLTHVNPYTGLAYKDEPSIAIVELANEDGTLDGYLGGSFNGTYTGKLVQGIWGPMINQSWHQWLTKKYASNAGIAAAWNARAAGTNMIVNPSYSNNFSGWAAFAPNSGATANRTLDGAKNAAKISITAQPATPQPYHILFAQVGTLDLKAGERYEVSFDIEGSVAGNISCELVYNTAINGKYGNFLDSVGTNFFNNVPVTTTKTTRSVVFNCKETVVGGNIKFDFALGKFGIGDVWISNVVFRKAALKALDAGEDINSLNIARPYLFAPFDDYTIERQADTVRFYYELEYDFGVRMMSFARGLGVRQLLTVNNWSTGGNASTCAQSAADVMDAHIYWDHPSSSNITNFTMHNKSPVGDAAISMPHLLVYNAVKDKPFILSEVDNTFPAKYEYEFFPMLVPYAALHNVSGIFKFAYTHYDLDTLAQQYPYNFFNTSNNPLMKIMSIVYSIAFIKGYISQANTEVALDYTPDYTIQNLRRFSANKDFNLYPAGGSDFPIALPATHKIRKRFNKGVVTDPSTVLPDELPALAIQTAYTSDTGEITWDRTASTTAYIKVDAAKFQSLTGRIAGRSLATSNMSINVDVDSAVSLLSMDDSPLQTSKKMLLTLLTEQKNTGQVKNDSTGNMTNWGAYPVMFNKVSGVITITLADASKYAVYVLDVEGKRSTKAKTTKTATTITIDTSLYYTPWFLIVQN
ncbi:hypothetical protein Back11_11870 [Paenibacillus baekrokdamisoli]|uniref:Uncharacterized protein n=1 Tax=Paenibacillus baekrokdamisoli TaxID=1712516 RepID=A0A3G9INM8_9BACL|nr:hypothetical protein [Paenibacillus baekrokdamisoli]MBB3070492.1 hypothetical protein [Paenibacillus baekrokdamisoli]BBH19842.1 hypothetical protein Back11_11870 [Paenibacillus baekrokdamisoli]